MDDHAIHRYGRCRHYAVAHDALEILDFFERGIHVLLGQYGFDELVGCFATCAAAAKHFDLWFLGHFDSSLNMTVEWIFNE